MWRPGRLTYTSRNTAISTRGCSEPEVLTEQHAGAFPLCRCSGCSTRGLSLMRACGRRGGSRTRRTAPPSAPSHEVRAAPAAPTPARPGRAVATCFCRERPRPACSYRPRWHRGMRMRYCALWSSVAFGVCVWSGKLAVRVRMRLELVANVSGSSAAICQPLVLTFNKPVRSGIHRGCWMQRVLLVLRVCLLRRTNVKRPCGGRTGCRCCTGQGASQTSLQYRGITIEH